LNKTISICCIITFISLFIASCITITDNTGNTARNSSPSERSIFSRERGSSNTTARDNRLVRKNTNEVENIRKKLVEGAHKFKGARSLVVNGRRFNMDCSGVVAAIYYYAGIDLQKYFPYHTGSGTERIYAILRERRLIKKTWLPKPGDIVFWDNTFDRNRNGRADDPLTHVGMVVSVDRQGNITYVHHNYRRGIVFEYMNIRQKNVESQIINGQRVIINSPMRAREHGTRGNNLWLSGQLVNSFGEAYHLE